MYWALTDLVPWRSTPSCNRASSLLSHMPLCMDGASEYTQRFLQSLLVRLGIRLATFCQLIGDDSNVPLSTVHIAGQFELARLVEILSHEVDHLHFCSNA